MNNTEVAYGCYSVTRLDIGKHSKLGDLNNEMKYIYTLCYIGTTMLATGNANGSIHIFNLENNKKTHRIEESCLPIRSICHDKDNNRLIYGCDDLHINMIDMEKMRVFNTLVGHGDYISNIYSANGLYYSSSLDGCIKLWDARLKSGLVDNIFTDGLDDMAVSGNHLVVSSESNVYIFNKS
jgi:WD40 repeat protein